MGYPQAFLDEACGNDTTLRRRVEALLELHEGAGPFLQTPALEQMAACTPLDSTQSPEGFTGAAPSGRDPVLGLLEPANVAVLVELKKPQPRPEVIERLMKRFIYSAGIIGVLQIATLVIMTKLASG